MDVEIDNLEINAGSEDNKGFRGKSNYEFDESQLELQIEKCVERLLRQIMR